VSVFYSLKTKRPIADPSCFVAPGARIIGSVELLEGASVWFNAVLRGDNEPIAVGKKTNVQDGAVIHTDPGFEVVLGEGVTVGHQAMIHGATVGSFSLIGIQAIVLNGAQIGKHCLIAAGALVTEGMVIPDGSLVMGSPAKIAKPLDPEKFILLEKSAEVYQKKASLYQASLQPQ